MPRDARVQARKVPRQLPRAHRPGRGPGTSRLRCQHSCRPKRAGLCGRLLGVQPPGRCTHAPTPAPHQPGHICVCRACPSGGAGPCSWFVGLWARWRRLPAKVAAAGLPGAPEATRRPSRTPGINGASTLSSGPTGPVLGAGTGPGSRFVFSGFCWWEHARRPLLGACVSGASKPKSLFGGRGAPSTRVVLVRGAAPGVCMQVDCQGTIWGGGHCSWTEATGVVAVYTGHPGVACGPPPLFTCVSGSGVLPGAPPRACGAPRRRC